MKINGFLKEELSIAEGKLVRLELEEQEKTCGMLLDNVSRLKENHNLINHRHHPSGHWQTLPQQTPSSRAPTDKQDTLTFTSHL
jgi:hypothetical protein